MRFMPATAAGALALIATTSAMAEITLYQGEGFRGRALTTNKPISDLERMRGSGRIRGRGSGLLGGLRAAEFRGAAA